jgi:hypothetical protein
MDATRTSQVPARVETRRALSRARWAALGAAVAVSLGGGGLLAASAAGPSAASSTVTVDPCRLVDTRQDGDPIGAHETVTFSARDLCAVPATATALVANVTAVDPSAVGYLTVFPADVPRPQTSTVNWEAGTTAVANQATIALSSDGKFSVFNMAGDVDLVVDISGYLVPASSGKGDKGDKGATGDTGARGPAGAAGQDGATGEAGVPGEQGEPGDIGTPGVPGEQGEPGDPGDPGVPGERGDPGAPGADNAHGYHLFGQGQSQLFVDLGTEFTDSQFVVECITDSETYVFTTGIHYTNGYEQDAIVSLSDGTPVALQGGQTATVLPTSEPSGTTVTTVKAFIGKGTGGSEVTVTLVANGQFHDCWAYVHVIWFPATPTPIVLIPS